MESIKQRLETLMTTLKNVVINKIFLFLITTILVAVIGQIIKASYDQENVEIKDVSFYPNELVFLNDEKQADAISSGIDRTNSGSNEGHFYRDMDNQTTL